MARPLFLRFPRNVARIPLYKRLRQQNAGEMIKQPTATHIARVERMRIAAQAGAEARAHFQAQDIAIRKNMERLRAIRLAKEAEDAAIAPKLAATPRPSRKRKSKLV